MQLPQAAAVGGPWMVDGEHWPVLLVGGPRMVDNGVIFNPWQCWLTNRQQEGLNKVDDGCQKEAETFFNASLPHLTTSCMCYSFKGIRYYASIIVHYHTNF